MVDDKILHKNSYPSEQNAIVDSGSSCFYFFLYLPQMLTTKVHQQIRITQPDGNTIKYNIKGKIPIIPQLPIKARESHGFKDIYYPLISVAKLCDANCKEIFEKVKVTIIHKNKIIAQPNSDFPSKLWTLQ